ncbi:hypothetical protein MAP00_006578 [Monascus purpureus]|nr:hypothetical protein MAP00_006578 [Monascus purpureus]
MKNIYIYKEKQKKKKKSPHSFLPNSFPLMPLPSTCSSLDPINLFVFSCLLGIHDCSMLVYFDCWMVFSTLLPFLPLFSVSTAYPRLSIIECACLDRALDIEASSPFLADILLPTTSCSYAIPASSLS